MVLVLLFLFVWIELRNTLDINTLFNQLNSLSIALFYLNQIGWVKQENYNFT